MRVMSRRCTNFRQPAVRIAALTAKRSGYCGAPIAKVAIGGSLGGLIAALRHHLPFGSEAFWVLLALSEETR
jgi:hypothetical protein